MSKMKILLLKKNIKKCLNLNLKNIKRNFKEEEEKRLLL
jgi:hypothetical protein